jgi:hypothetical protein
LDRNAYTGDLNATYGADASNLAVGLGGKNLLPANTLPSSAAGYVKGVSDPATVNSTNPTFATGGTTGLAGYSRNALGAVYLNVSGTPPAGSYADLFIDGAAKRPVVGGRRYEFAFDLSTHRCSGSAIILWYDASNANIGLSQSASIASAADYGTIDFPRALLLATAPAAATSAIVFARMLHDGVGINPYMFTSRWYFAEALAAQTVASPWTPSQHESLVAINDPVTGLSDKISKAAASILNALITISTSGGIQVGTASWNAGSPTGTGVVITPMGLALVQAGVVKALLPVSGEPTFGGRLTAAYGDFLGNIQAGPAGGFRVEMGPDDPTYALWAGTGTKNDANAIFFLKRSGAAYFGGALSSGTLKTSVANPSTAADAEIVDGPFGSIGHPITVNVGYDFHYTRSSTRHTLAIAGSPAPQATIQLWNGSTLVQTVTINGTSSVINDSEPGVPSNGQVTISGGFTWTDTSGSTAQRTLRAVISSRQYPNIGDLADKGSGTDAAAVITQQLSINTTEQ